MEESNHYPSMINSTYLNKTLNGNVLSLNKKRKLQAEQLGLPLPKHKCWIRSSISEYDSPSATNLEADDFYECTFKTENVGGVKYECSKPGSANDSNSFYGDVGSVLTASNQVQIEMQYPTAFLHDVPSTSSANQNGDFCRNILYSLDSRSLTKSSGDKGKLPCGEQEDSPKHDDLGFDTSLDYEEHLMELGNHGDCNYFEYGKQYTDEELEDILHCNGVNTGNYVISSGRLNVNRDNLSSKKKLTIDKEFEQYFSTLML